MLFYILRFLKISKNLHIIMKNIHIWLAFSELSFFLSFSGIKEISISYKITIYNRGNKKVVRFSDMKNKRIWAALRFYNSCIKIFNTKPKGRLLKIIKMLKTTRAIRISKIKTKIKWRIINIISKWTVLHSW